MTRRKGESYLGGHTVLSQPPGLYMRRLEVDSIKAKKRAKYLQRRHDWEQAQERERREVFFAGLDAAMKAKRDRLRKQYLARRNRNAGPPAAK